MPQITVEHPGLETHTVDASSLPLAELHGERFPQKSTDFYPKMLSGFLMCRLRVENP